MAKKISDSSVKVLRRIGVLSFAKLYGVMGLVLGFIIGFFVALGSTFAGAAAGDAGLLALGWMAIIIVPIFYGVVCFLAGLITAWLYNVFAGWIGGIELTLE